MGYLNEEKYFFIKFGLYYKLIYICGTKSEYESIFYFMVVMCRGGG